MNRLILLFLISLFAFAQQSDLLVDWLSTLQSLQSRAKSGSPADLSKLISELKTLTGEISAQDAVLAKGLAPLPSTASSQQELLAYVSDLRRQIEDQLRARPGSAFQLGRVEVNVSADAVQVATATTLDESEFRERNARVVPDALNLIPGVSIQRIGPRNERGVFIRGFDVRQVPVYMDGIPVYVPYDGYVDLDRFLTYDVSEIQVAKGFTSPLYGPNAIGGAVNLISKEPTKGLNLDLGSGYASGDQVHGFLNAGTRWKKFWLQGGFAWLSSDTYPLSGNFKPVPLQPAGDRLNAYQTDYKGRVRVAWTPKQGDQYTFTYANQKGEKGNPTYAGTDPTVRPRYWQWPEWNKESFYFIGNKSLGESSYVRARLYYDKFNNLIKAYDNNQYNSQTLPSAFTSPYDDDTYGSILELGTRALKRHSIKTSFYFKDDNHREGNVGEPVRSFRDQSLSFGFEDTIQLGRRTSAIVGFSADRINVLNAQNFTGGQVLPFAKNDLWAYNPQAGIFHGIGNSGKVHLSFARKTRLPTIKDRYSYRMGQAIPNPDLREERSDNLEVGYSHLLGRKTLVEGALFRSGVSNSTQRYFVQPNVFQLRNLGEARYLGGEFSVRSNPLSSLQLTSNYTYLSRRNQSNPSVIMIDTPRHKIYSSATYRLYGRVSLLADLRYEGGRWNQNDGGRYLRASNFTTVGLGATAQLYKQVEMQAGVGNLFDRNYWLVDGYPESGRNVYINLRYRF
ncbi:TonB-dependent receptor plug domain-containing protein [Bryobacter aggregatus]|uniref:TonB-dependent receptor plug domain-containing protein n=1 Tax=Bryobacter aggregatus TaxID=360054 RepID=UPI00068EA1A1|nr:TonB-dependent receptor [Bryobacter aggregatus]